MRSTPPGPTAAKKTTRKDECMIAPEPFYPTQALAGLRALIGRRPEVIYLDVRDLCLLLGNSEVEAEEARHWLVENGLEVRA